MSSSSTGAKVRDGITRKALLVSVASGVVLGGLLYSVDRALSGRLGQVKIGIADSPRGSALDQDIASQATVSPIGVTTSVPSNKVLSPVSTTTTSTSTTTSTTLALPANVDAKWRDFLVSLTNAERTGHGLDALESCGRLHVAAQGHGQDMRDQDFYDHTNPYTGSGPGERSTAAGYQWSYIGENIAMGYETPKSVLRAWMNSEGHRANILSDFSHIGIGIVAVGSGEDAEGYYWVQKFGRGGDCG